MILSLLIYIIFIEFGQFYYCYYIGAYIYIYIFFCRPVLTSLRLPYTLHDIAALHTTILSSKSVRIIIAIWTTTLPHSIRESVLRVCVWKVFAIRRYFHRRNINALRLLLGRFYTPPFRLLIAFAYSYTNAKNTYFVIIKRCCRRSGSKVFRIFFFCGFFFLLFQPSILLLKKRDMDRKEIIVRGTVTTVLYDYYTVVYTVAREQ